jgi:hypothetical protein
MQCWECGRKLTKLTGSVAFKIGRNVDGKFNQLGETIHLCCPSVEEVFAGNGCASAVRVRNERHGYIVLPGENL